MTIQQLADAHVGHSEEIDEDSTITMQRESFKWGAIHVLREVQAILNDANGRGIDPSESLWAMIDEFDA